jgi:hypothetical protein
MPAWKWWRAYCKTWSHLRWFAMRLTAHGVSASACEHNWSTYEWIHNKKRNRLGLSRREACALILKPHQQLSRSAMYESGFVEWDVEMVFEEPETKPCVSSRSSPHRAARPALGSQRPPPSRTVAKALMLPLALPVAQGTVVKWKLGSPRALQPPASLAAIAPAAPEPSIDRARLRAHVRPSRRPPAAQSCARAHS